MKKINGFKCFEDAVSFDFGDTTFIAASNGQGKSSIADAIAFAFMGTPFFGDKGLDRLHSRNTDEMTVSVDFTDDTGEEHNLTCTRKRENTTIAYDGLTARQSDLNSAFGDRDIFLSVLNPLYFINVLGDGGKNLLEKLLPIVSHDQVMAALSGHSQEILEGQPLSSPETFIKNCRSDLKKLEETLIGCRSQKELVDAQLKERAANISKLRADIDAVTSEMTELAEIRDNGFDRKSEEAALAELRKRRAELLSDAAHISADKSIQGIMCEIKESEKFTAKMEAKTYSSPYTAQIAEAEAGFKVLSDEHGRVKTALANTVVGYKCPACSVEITDGNIDAIKTDLERRLSLLINDGKTAKTYLASLKAKDNAAKREFDEQKETLLAAERGKLAALNQQLQEMNVARELDSQDYGEQLSAVEAQITCQELLLTNGNLSPEQMLQFAELEKTKQQYEVKITALSEVKDDDYTAIIAETESEITQLKILINEAVQYTAKRIELMLGGLNMTSTEIVLTETIKTTGEVRDCFRFSYDGRDYKCLSLSEKVRAGLDISTLIGKLSGRNYPVFVDNGESICSFGKVRLQGQVIIARVVRDQLLQVTYKSRLIIAVDISALNLGERGFTLP